MIRDAIKQILLMRGSVSFPYKNAMLDWMGLAELHVLSPISERKRAPYMLRWPKGYETFEDLNDAINFYMRLVFTKKNLGLAIQGIHHHKLSKVDLDDLSEGDLKNLIKRYNDEYFAQDYPKETLR